MINIIHVIIIPIPMILIYPHDNQSYTQGYYSYTKNTMTIKVIPKVITIIQMISKPIIFPDVPMTIIVIPTAIIVQVINT